MLLNGFLGVPSHNPTSRPLWLANFLRVACQTDRDLGNIRRIIERCIATRFTGRPWEGI